MATSFKGWGSSWLDSWGPVTVDPNEMRGSASFSFTASLQVNSGDMQGSASFRIDAILGVGEPRFSQEIELRRRYYVKRKKQILLFNSADEADAYIAAQDLADKAIEEAQRTSRRARKRLRERVYKVSVEPISTVELPLLESMIGRYAIDVDLPSLIAQEAWDRVMQIHALAMEMQDEDDVMMLLLA